MEWYYAINNNQQGPVTTERLRELLSEGMITEASLVWKRGMAGWEPISTAFKAYQLEAPTGEGDCPSCGQRVKLDVLISGGDKQVCPDCRDHNVQGNMGTKAIGRKRVGTGGVTPNREIRQQAREALSGKWGIAVGAVFVYIVVAQALAIIPVVGQIGQLLIAGPLLLGLTGCFMRIVRNDEPTVSAVFGGFSSFGLGLGIYIVMMLIMLLCGMGAAIPGIVMLFATGAYEHEESLQFVIWAMVAVIPVMVVFFYVYLMYAMAFYIAHDEPELGAFESLKKSSRMMKGHKGRLCLLILSFFGWSLLGMLAFIVGMLWAYAYYFAALSVFYDDLKEEA